MASLLDRAGYPVVWATPTKQGMFFVDETTHLARDPSF